MKKNILFLILLGILFISCQSDVDRRLENMRNKVGYILTDEAISSLQKQGSIYKMYANKCIEYKVLMSEKGGYNSYGFFKIDSNNKLIEYRNSRYY